MTLCCEKRAAKRSKYETSGIVSTTPLVGFGYVAKQRLQQIARTAFVHNFKDLAHVVQARDEAAAVPLT